MGSMSTALRTLPVRALASTAALVGVAILVAGCTSAAPHASTTTGAAKASSSGTPTDPASAGTDSLSATKLTMPCDTLAPAATVSASYAGMSLDTTATPPKDSDAEVIAAYDGTSCTWKDASGETMTLAVGQFGSDSITKLKNGLVTLSNPVPTYNGEGYFQLADDTGTAEAFSGSYWVVAISKTFGEPGTAEPLVDAAIAAVKAR
jgi:hypothetical protein